MGCLVVHYGVLCCCVVLLCYDMRLSVLVCVMLCCGMTLRDCRLCVVMRFISFCCDVVCCVARCCGMSDCVF